MIPALDELTGGLAEGALTVFTGKPGQGKSTLAGQLLLAAIEQGYSICAYSGELTKERFQEWINLQAAGSEYIGLKYDAVRDKQIPCVSYTVQQRLMDYYRDRFYLFDNNEVFEANQSESILKVFTMAVRRYGCKLFLADKAKDYEHAGLWGVRLLFTTENSKECLRVVRRYQGEGTYAPNEFTRGLYYRGVD